MSWPIDTTSPRVVRFSRHWRRISVALVMGLALAVAACGTSTGGGGGGQPTPTAKPPTATATPVPCTNWRIVASPNGTKYQMSVLSSVSALSPTAAWAVGGNYGEGGPVTSLIEAWNGTAWQIVANPGTDFLGGVAAVSQNDVWAVGSLSTYQTKPVTLIEHWNGTQWSTVPSPDPGASSNALSAVVARAANDVWTVGSYSSSSSTSQPLIERWNGASWQVIASPNPNGATASSFSAVARIPGTSHLWATGSVRYGPPPDGGIGYFQPLIERWEGTSWQIVTSPTLPSGSFGGELRGVVALSATDVWAVGDYTASNHTIRTLIAHWDGTSWQVTTGPDAWGSLVSVAAAGARDVRAVGHIVIGDGANQHLLIEQWNGTLWQTVTSPEPTAASHSGLGSISTDGAGSYWVVGDYVGSAGTSNTLALRCP